MQYVGRAIGSVSKTWSSINPATLSGAIDVIVVEQPDGTLACSPFHVRFGKFRILKPSQKKVSVIVNGKPTNVPMKLSDSGEAYFVFETNTNIDDIPDELLSSPVLSATNSPPHSPQSVSSSTEFYQSSPKYNNIKQDALEEPDFLDINSSSTEVSGSPTNKTQEFQQNLNKRLTKIHIPSRLDNNGDLLLDIEGYKPDQEKVHDTDKQLKQLLKDELGTAYDISSFIKEDSKGIIRIINPHEQNSMISPPGSPYMLANDDNTSMEDVGSDGDSQIDTGSISSSTNTATTTTATNSTATHNFIKTIRLTSEQLRCLDLKYGENDLMFSVDQGKAIVTSKLFVWRWDVPVVISDIDGTITKSDALGHVMTIIGKDWTHPGVAKLFSEISRNGYNIMYLTARSTGQADSTRSYLDTIIQDGIKLPKGPVILSPDRTMAALRREVILKKPEIFKIACLNDIRSIYFGRFEREQEERAKLERSKLSDQLDAEKDADSNEATNKLKRIKIDDDDKDEKLTPFFAGFGNRITDALSYRTVGIPSSRIFTINPEGEVHMELLELAGYRSSYIHINSLVDHFFPPVVMHDNVFDVRSVSSVGPTMTSMDSGNNSNIQSKSDINASNMSINNVQKTPIAFNNIDTTAFLRNNQEAKFTDVNFWRDPLLDLDTLSDITSDEEIPSPTPTQKNGSKISTNKKQNSSFTATNLLPLIGSPNGNNSTKQSDLLHDTGQITSTPKRMQSSPTSKDIGKQIYLQLGSPLTSPKLTFIDDNSYNEMTERSSSPEEEEEEKNEHISPALEPLHVNAEADLDEGLDDEFDEDEFDEDDFVD